jgi:O-methyltransferase
VGLTRFVRQKARGLVRGLGFEIRRLQSGNDGQGVYARVEPRATYSPWNRDAEFLATYAAVRENTKVDIYRCHELWSLVEQVRHLDGCLLEVGVWRGGTGAVLAKKATMCGIQGTVYLCDTFEGVVKATSKDSTYRGGEHADTSEETAAKLLEKLNLKNYRLLKGIFPDDTAKAIEHERVRFCHIDVDVYQSAYDVAAWVWKRMPVGGIIVYDDYGFSGCDGVQKHVDEQRSLDDRVVIHNLNGHAVIVKTA